MRSRIKRILALAMMAFVTSVLVTGTAVAADCTHIDDPFQVLDLYLDMDPADWTTIVNDGTFQIEKPAMFSCGTELPILVSVRRKLTTGGPKVSLKIDIDQYVIDQEWGAPPLSNAGHRKLSLENGGSGELLREGFAWMMMARAGMIVGNVSWVRVHVNGQEIGVYTRVEQVDKSFLRRHLKEDEYFLWKLTEQRTREAESDPYMSALCYDPFNSSCALPPDGYDSLHLDLDLPQLFTQATVSAFIVNPDSLLAKKNNFFMYNSPLPRRYFPWDLDTLMNNQARTTDEPHTLGNPSSSWETPLLADPNLLTLFDTILVRLMQDPFHPDAIDRLLDELAVEVGPAMDADPNENIGHGSFSGEAAYMKQWVRDRITYLESILPSIPPFPIVINEVMASNTGTITDEAGEFADWVELHNRGTASMSLDGLYLSDTPAFPRRFAFPPGTVIPAGGYLIVWCDNDTFQGPLHTGFKLDADGETIGLYATDAEFNRALDFVWIGPQTPNVSIGRFPDGSPGQQTLSSTSPGGSNGGPKPGVVGPTLNVAHGTGSSLVLDWQPSCSSFADDYAIYEGEIGNWYSHTLLGCTDNLSDLTEQITPLAGNRYYLVVPLLSGSEGSYGSSSGGLLRPPGTSTCAPQQSITTTTCGIGACQVTVDGCFCTPGIPAAEICNNIDDNCNGVIDDSLGQTFCGVGACFVTTQNCIAGVPQTCTPGTPTAEICNNIDDDCNLFVDDGLGQTNCGIGACEVTTDNCISGVPQTCTPGSPTTEICNAIDDDCDGAIDNGAADQPTTCGVGACSDSGVIACIGGVPQPDTCTPGTPTAETCNAIDDDCDGAIDNGAADQPTTCGVGACGDTGVIACVGGVPQPDTCTPGTPIAEACNGIDDDCDGVIDNGTDVPTTCGVGACGDTGMIACVGGVLQADTCTPGTPLAETCNAIDDDCDGTIDNGVDQPTTCGVGACSDSGVIACVGGVLQADTCTPGTPTTEICNAIDDDCDGAIDNGAADQPTTCGVGACSDTGVIACVGGVPQPDSCTPGTPTAETCNAVDDDCDGTIDNGTDLPTTCGIGACGASGLIACVGGVPQPDSCTPGTPTAETCNAVDDDCDGTVDGFVTGCGVGECAAVGTCTVGIDSCTVGTPVPETCDNLDNDCDGAIDNGTDQATACGVGACSDTGLIACVGGIPQPDTCTPGTPTAETCNAIDDDCDGAIDNGAADQPTTCGVGACSAAGVIACVGGVPQPDTCSPGTPTAETCNAVDDDCDGTIDNGTDQPTTCGIGACGATGLIACVGGVPQPDSCTPGTPTAETCNAIDDDCDGTLDNGTDEPTTCGVGVCSDTGVIACIGGVPQPDSCTPGTPTAEACDGLDNNCDGTVDDGFIDTDIDGLADCIDPDDDNDTILDPSDNCPLIPNTLQDDLDQDGQGNECDADADGDGFDKTGGSGPQEFAGGEISVAGAVTGSYLDTQVSDDVYEKIKENNSGGSPSTRFSFLEHKWTFTLSGSSALDFNLEAYHSANGEGDDVLFSYSTDDVTYTDMFILTKIADDNIVMSFTFPAPITGTLYIRAVDTDQTPGNDFRDDLFVDQMYVGLEDQADCDDLNADVFPGNPEVCDNLDNDCDTTVDNFATSCGVGGCAAVGTCTTGIDSCAPGTPTAETCNAIDDDCDGTIDNGTDQPTTCGIGACGAAGVIACVGGVPQPDTCTPGTPTAETCNAIDDDCDGTIDNGADQPTSCGVGACGASGVIACIGGVPQPDTCTPGTPTAETCNAIDDDCDGTIDNGTDQPTTCGIGACGASGVIACVGGVPQPDTCTPGTPTAETCNAIDDDCDGTIDNGAADQPTTCGVGACSATGIIACVGGVPQPDTCTPGTPTAETCNNIDDDCDGTIDNGTDQPTTCGIGACGAAGVIACVGGVPQPDTCSPGTPTTETCNAIDDDCDGAIDNGADQPTSCGVGACGASGVIACVGGVPQPDTCTPGTPTAETCNAIDDDCDGTIDNGADQPTSCGVGACGASGVIACVGGVPQPDTCSPGTPTTETCNAIDDDCDGTIDNGADQPTTCGIGACGASGVIACVGGVPQPDTCSPGTPTTETCNAIDDDCDGAIDNGAADQPTTCGVGACSATGIIACVGGVPQPDTCSPGTPTAETCNAIDDDCDGTIDNGTDQPTTCGIGACGAAGVIACVGGVPQPDTCTPGTPTAETCNAIDDDCDGTIDNGADQPTSCGVGACGASGVIACVGGVPQPDTCSPGTPTAETCNAIDDDCDGTIDNGTDQPTTCGIGACGAAGVIACVGGVPQPDTCTPGTPTAETCNAIDDDCDGTIDNGTDQPTSCGVGACGASGVIACVGGVPQPDTCSPGTPTTETCNAIDDDCDGTIDNGADQPTTCGIGACGASGVIACVGGVPQPDTCLPGTPTTETCNAIDDDCDGAIDNGAADQPTTCGVGACSATGIIACVGGVPQPDTCSPGTPTAETCNAIDDDCDGTIDNGTDQPTTCGIGACGAAGVIACVGGVPQPDTCTPGTPTAETCNAIDDDCDGTVDGFATSCGVGECAAVGTCSAGLDSCTVGTPVPETCDNLDNDCDGTIDNGTDQPTTCGIGACGAAGVIACIGGVPQPDTCTPGTPTTETCNAIDDDCDGTIDNGADQPTSCGVGACGASGVIACIGGVPQPDTCTPGTPTAETCNAIDDDCDGTIDNGADQPTSCGVGACGASGVIACIGGVPQPDTCTPGTPTAETCNAIDDDCDGAIDNGAADQPTTCGVGACSATGMIACVGGVPQPDTCTPGTPTAETCNAIDDDCDGTIDNGTDQPTTCGVGACGAAGLIACVGGVPQPDTCTPGTPTAETCNAIDDDCDGTVDGFATSCGVGECAAVGTCSAGLDSCTVGTPVPETCDNLDNDCDGTIDNGTDQPTTCGIGACGAAGVIACVGGVPQPDTCTAGTPTAETCNAIDDDCDGTIDNGTDQPTTCGVGACGAAGLIACVGGVPQPDTCTPGTPTAETCNAIDDDCDGTIDNGTDQPTTCGVGACGASGVIACVGGVPQPDTCTPGTPTAETCNAIDDDCDGTIDNGTDQPTTCGIGACGAAGVIACVAGVPQPDTCTPGTPTAETCNAIDDDCDGTVDGFATSCGVGECAAVGTCTAGLDSCTVGTPVPETCDNLDNDCDGTIDNGTDQPTTCGIGACGDAGVIACVGGVPQPDTCTPGTPTAETCNAIDDDCDGTVDGFATSCGIGECAAVGLCDAGTDSCTAGTPTAEACDGLDNNCDGTIDDGFIDTDIDGLADCIDPDDDNDTIPDVSDNRPLIANTLQDDLDQDGQGDDCDDDADGDGFPKTGGSGSQEVAAGEIAVTGTVTGSYLDTHVSDNLYEVINENPSSGPPATKFSFLEHKWTFTLSGSSALNFNLEAYHTANSEGDDVLFSYSTDDVTYTDMFTLTKIADDDSVMSFTFPVAISGTLFVRAVDTDQTPGNNFRDDLFVDQMYLGLAAQVDCDDLNANVFPGNPEICDNLDNDCDTIVDDFATSCGVGECAAVGTCTAGLDSCAPGTPTSEVCDNLDNNCDGSIDEGLGQTTCGLGACEVTVDNCVGGVPQTCTPGTPTAETCNNIDDDCDGTIDNGTDQPTSCGVGACGSTGVIACVGGVPQPDTCTPGSPSTETCNNIDDDCDGTVDSFATSCGVGECTSAGTCTAGADSCTAGTPSAELCDNLDNDCDGTVDAFSTSCGVGECAATGTCTAGADSCTAGSPAAEICDNLDNDCDGTIDNGTDQPTTCGVGACGATGVIACVGGVPQLDTCTPGTPTAETCNNIDDDCDGTIDNGTDQPTTCGIGACGAAGVIACVGGVPQPDTCTPGSPSTETCNNIDDDCDGTIDNGTDQPTTCGVGACGSTGVIACVGGVPQPDTCTPGSPTTETCNNIDDDCDGTVDSFATSCGVGECAATGTCTAGADSCTAGSPSAEICDNLDNDCDGTIDNGTDQPTTCGVGACGSTGVIACVGGVPQPDTCTPGSPSAETCNNIDDDCDGTVDNGTDQPTTCGVGACGSTGVIACVGGVPQPDTCTPGSPSAETCNNIDDDCDGTVDSFATSCGVGECAATGTCTAGADSCAAGSPTAEICDNLDNDCDGTIDSFATSCGVGECAATGTCTAGADSCTAGTPSAEICDNLDNDCDGTVDNGTDLPTTCGVGACGSTGVIACVGGVPQPDTCTPGSPSTETCNNIDDDCDGTIDNGTDQPTTCGVGACGSTGVIACVGGVPQPDTCTPGSPSTETCNNIDDDCDGTIDNGTDQPTTCGVGACGSTGVIACVGGVPQPDTCMPGSPSTETCNNIDDDCDGTVDAFATSCGVGECAATGTCTAGADSCAAGSPTAEICDNLDNDCDGTVDSFATSCGVGECAATGTCTAGADSCTAGSPSAEICDNLDNDCDGTIDNGTDQPTTCGVGACGSTGVIACVGGVPQPDTCTPGSPSTETCNNIDDDCDGTIDNGTDQPTTCGVGACGSTGVIACVAGVPQPDTCTPGSPSTETCNNIDDDCDGTIDNGTDQPTTCGVGACGSTGVIACVGGVPQADTCTPGSPSTETCNNIDDDCDGTIDSFATSCGVGECAATGTCTAGADSCAAGSPTAEICDNLDNDCDGTVDSFATSCGVGECAATGTCTAGADSCTAGSPSAEICDNLDNDCDGTIDNGTDQPTTCGVGACGSTGVIACVGGVPQADTCTPGSPSAETCNNIDDDCDGTIDNGTDQPTTCGVGACGSTGVIACVAGVPQPDTCTPGSPSTETCNNIDDDCDGTIDSFATSCGVGECAATGTCAAGADSCAAGSPTAEICDNLDNDCDGTVDSFATSCGVGECAATGTCTAGADSCTAGSPSAEICDNLDNDCDGTIDNGTDQPTTCGVGACGSTGVIACVAGVPQPDTCTPGSPSTETCNNIDDDCDGTIDNGTDQPTTCGVGACGSTGVIACVGGVPQADTCTPGSPSTETCNNIDDDCDGTIDSFATSCGVGECAATGTCTAGADSCAAGSPTVEICDNLDNDCDGTIDSFATSCGVGECAATGTCTAGADSCTAGSPSAEICDNLDNDCDGTVDNGTNQPTTCGVGACGSTGVIACVGGVPQPDTCTPGSPSTETCNNIDDDCDGTVDAFATSCGVGECAATGTCTAGADSCAAGSPTAEICDNLDNDCDGTVDSFATSCGVGECAATGTCTAGADSCTAGSPSAEICDNLDNDCDGTVDNGTDQPTTCGVGACGSTGVIACVAGVPQPDTCTPGSPSTETCNNIDDDCDGTIDNGTDQPTTCGVGACGSTGVIACVGGVPQADTCTPGSPSTETCNNIDDDCDGTIDSFATSCGVGECAATGTCTAGADSCAAGSPTAEICDNLDNDCDGTIDSFATSCGVGECAATGTCTAGADSCAAGSPSAEICDNLDNDCDGTIDNGTDQPTTCGVGACGSTGVIACVGGVPQPDTCTPGSPSTETCNNIDDDCDGTVDSFATSCGVGECAATGTCTAGADSCAAGSPTAEICDNLDNDCDGTIDNGTDQPTTCGVGACGSTGVIACVGGVPQPDTCTPGSPTTETCNNIDDDCDGTIDSFATSCGVGECAATGTCTAGADSCTAGSPSAEICDNLDNDCDGTVDNVGPSNQTIILSTSVDATLGGLAFREKDLPEYDPGVNTATLFFDGDLITSGASDIDAVSVLSNGNIVLSTESDETLGGLSFRDGDLVEYNPGSNTAVLLFNEDLFTTDADIDAAFVLSNGHIVLSTAAGETLGGLTFRVHDLVEYDPVTDTATLFFDGDLITSGLPDIDGVSVLSNGHIVLTTANGETLAGLTFRDGDLVEYDPIAGIATLFFNEDLFTAGAADIDAMAIRSASQCPTAITDDFSSPDLSNWTIDSATWTLDSVAEELDYTRTVEGVIRYTASAVDSADQWASVRLASFVSANHEGGLILRAGSTAAAAKYAVAVSGTSGVVHWYKLDGATRTAITTSGACGSWAQGDVLGAAVSGTGASTVVDVWRNPTGTFSAWGTPTCSITTGCGANCVDVGDYVGIVAVDTVDVGDRSFDDFEAGSQ